MIRVDFTIEQAKTLMRVLDHVRTQATGTAASGYGIDELCRKDSAQRWLNLRNLINARLPKKYRFP